MTNQTSLLGFVLLEFSEVRELQIIYFWAFLVLYVGAITGNLLIIAAVIFDHRLHSPMYFFLMNLAMQDIGQITVIIPKSMANSLFNTRYISYSGCAAQVFFFVFFVGSDFCLLTVMAYDRYVAICNPLQYEVILNGQTCIEIVATVWVVGFIYATCHTCGTFATDFCSNVVNQFFCEIPHLLKLSCSDMNLIETGAILLFSVIGLGCFIFIIVTYVQIFSAVLGIRSSKGRQKAFSTCLPHLVVIFLLIVTAWFSYLSPIFNNVTYNLYLGFAAIYTTVPPLLNPVIYSMRNKDIKVAMSKLLGYGNSSKNILFSFLL